MTKYIAAIEIGSSRIKGTVASARSGQPVKVLAIEDAPAGDSVRYGRIQNVREANDIVNDIIRRLENSPEVHPGRISTVFIADGGRSLVSSTSDAVLNFGGEEELTLSTLERLQKEAVFNLGSSSDVLAIAPRRFFVDSAEVKKIVGAFGSTVRGEFTIITQAPENHKAIERLFIESEGKEIKHNFVTRLLAQTEMALSDSDRQVGTLFVDFGAETTTLAAFRDGALVFAAALPIGGANITRDLSSVLNITLDRAESIKHTKGLALADRNKFDAPDDETAEIVALTSARAGEILANVNNILVEAGLRGSDFPGGIVITGGASRLKGFSEMVEQLTKLKVRRASVDSSVAIMPGVNIVDNFDIISLAKYAAAHSEADCVVYPEKTVEQEPVFVPDPEVESMAGRREIAEDDKDLLKDDDFRQPDNIIEDINELPKQAKDATTTRFNLMERIKKLGVKTADLFKPPFEGEDRGMD